MTDTELMKAPKSRGEIRRRAVLEAAIELFLENGYAGTSLDMVIARAGGSRRTLYEHFGNKEGLFAASVEQVMSEILVTLENLEFRSDEPEAQLIAVGQGFLQTLIAPRSQALFRIVLSEIHRFPELGCRFFEDGPVQGYQRVAAYFERQNAAGRLHIPEPELAARQFLEMIKGELHLCALMCPGRLPGDAGLKEHVRKSVRYFLQTTAVAG